MIKAKFRSKLIISLVLVIVAVLSFTTIARYTSDPENHKKAIATLDEKRNNVLELTALTTASSLAISMLPGDTGQPIANKIADLSSYLLIVLCAIFLEKYLLTLTALAAFKLLIPLGIILLIAWLFSQKDCFFKASINFIILGILLYITVPTSVMISNTIDATYDTSLQIAMSEAEANNKAIEDATAEANVSEEATTDTTSDNKNSSVWDKISGTLDNAKNAVSKTIENVASLSADKISELTNKAKTTLTNFIEATAVMIITSCIIPIIVLLFYLWLLKVFVGIK